MTHSSDIIIQSPTSFVGSARRLWKITKAGHPATKFLTVPLALLLIGTAWTLVAVYTLFFGILLVPYRLLRRGSRKRKQEMLRHAEVLAAIENQSTQTIYN